MKKYLLLAVYIMLHSITFGQKPIVVKEVLVESDKQYTKVYFIVEIPQAALKDIEKEWQRYAGENAKGKASVTNGEYLQIDAVNPSISANPFNLHCNLYDITAAIKLNVWLSQNDMPFISAQTDDAQNQAVKKYLRDFAVKQYKEAVAKELAIEKNKLQQMEKEYESLIMSEEKSNSKINKNERNTSLAIDEVDTNNGDIETVSRKIYNQKEMIDNNAADANAKKGAEKTLNELEDDKKDLQKKNTSHNKEVNKMDKQNRSKQRNIDEKKAAQENKLAALKTQKLKIEMIQTKWNNII